MNPYEATAAVQTWAASATAWHNGTPTSLSFDPLEERLWVSDEEGFLASYTTPGLQLFTSSRAFYPGREGEEDEDWCITSRPADVRVHACASGVAVSAGTSARVYDRNGALDGEVHASALQDLGTAQLGSPAAGSTSGSAASGGSAGSAAPVASVRTELRVSACLPLDSWSVPSSAMHLPPAAGTGSQVANRVVIALNRPGAPTATGITSAGTSTLHAVDATRFWCSQAASSSGGGLTVDVAGRRHGAAAAHRGGSSGAALPGQHTRNNSSGVLHSALSLRDATSVSLPHPVHVIAGNGLFVQQHTGGGGMRPAYRPTTAATIGTGGPTNISVIAAASGDSGGDVSLLDPMLRSKGAIGAFKGHPGGVVAVEARGTLVFTCGRITRGSTAPPPLPPAISGIAGATGAYNPYSASLAGAPPTGGARVAYGIGGGSGGSRPVPDHAVKVFDMRMMKHSAPLASVSHGHTPGGHHRGSAAPIWMRFLPESSPMAGRFSHSSHPPLLVGYSDGTFCYCDVSGDGVLRPLARIDPLATASDRAQVRAALQAAGLALPPTTTTGEFFAPPYGDAGMMGMGGTAGDEYGSVRMVAAALAPSGQALAAADADGCLHLITPVEMMGAGVTTSRAGGFSRPAKDCHAVGSWIRGEDTDPEAFWAQPTAAPDPLPVVVDASDDAGDASGARTGASAAARSGRGAVVGGHQFADADEMAFGRMNAHGRHGGGHSPSSGLYTAPGSALFPAHLFDAPLLVGTGYDAPVDAPGISLLAPMCVVLQRQQALQPDGEDANSGAGVADGYAIFSADGSIPALEQAWVHAWTAPAALLTEKTTAELTWFGHTRQALVWSAAASGGAGGYAGGARSARDNPYFLHTLPPARDRVSTLHTSTLDALMLPHKHRELDPFLLSYAERSAGASSTAVATGPPSTFAAAAAVGTAAARDKAAAAAAAAAAESTAIVYIDNRNPLLLLPPNSLMYGRRKAYVDSDPRHKMAGKSSLGVPANGTGANTLPLASGHMMVSSTAGTSSGIAGALGSERSRSDSLSTTSSTEDLLSLLGPNTGGGDAESGDGSDYEDEEEAMMGGLVPATATAKGAADDADDTDSIGDGSLPDDDIAADADAVDDGDDGTPAETVVSAADAGAVTPASGVHGVHKVAFATNVAARTSASATTAVVRKTPMAGASRNAAVATVYARWLAALLAPPPIPPLRPTRAYRRPEAKLVAGRGYEFDFSAHNNAHVPLAGLEECGPNSFAIPLLQLLFLMRPLRRRVQRHLCAAPACLTCELRFLFDALCQAPLMAPTHRVFSPQNFLRALLHSQEMRRMGVIQDHGNASTGAAAGSSGASTRAPSGDALGKHGDDGGSGADGSSAAAAAALIADPPRRLELFLRTLLDRVAKDLAPSATAGSSGAGGGVIPPASAAAPAATAVEIEGSPASSLLHRAALDAARGPVDAGAPDRLMSVACRTITTCSAGHSTSREGRYSMLEMTYPDMKEIRTAFGTPATSAASTPTAGARAHSGGAPIAAASPMSAGGLPTGGVPFSGIPFAAIIQQSFNAERRMTAWCEGCRAYVPLTQKRVPTELPPVLMVQANAAPPPTAGSSVNMLAAAERMLAAAPLAATATAGAAAAAAGEALARRSLWGACRRAHASTEAAPPTSVGAGGSDSFTVPAEVPLATAPALAGDSSGDAPAATIAWPPAHRHWCASTINISVPPAVPSTATGATARRATDVTVTDLTNSLPGAALSPSAAAAASGAAAGYELVAIVAHVRPWRAMLQGDIAASTAGSQAAAAAEAAAAAALQSSNGRSAHHFVLAAKVGYEGCLATSASTALAATSSAAVEPQWLLFNNFRISRVTQGEALSFAAPWKTPVFLIYQRTGADATPALARPSSLPMTASATVPAGGVEAERAAFVAARKAAGFLHPDAEAVHPLVADIVRISPAVAFRMPPSIPHQPLLAAAAAGAASSAAAAPATVVNLPFLDPADNPAAVAPTPAGKHAGGGGGGGWKASKAAQAAALSAAATPLQAVPAAARAVVAIDAEYVAVSTDRVRHRSDGIREVVEPGIRTPGRVTVLDAAGRNIMDQHIAAMEPVCDYLTRFSGLMPGDLHVETSKHRLHTHKDTHIKLRSLVDAGASFVGHGLTHDFKTLNLFVPASQIIDTLRIYKLPYERNLSLKFLASYVLNADIQEAVHDSGEDASMALKLYLHYLSVVEKEAAAGSSSAGDSAAASVAATPTTSGTPSPTASPAFAAYLEELYAAGRPNHFKPMRSKQSKAGEDGTRTTPRKGTGTGGSPAGSPSKVAHAAATSSPGSGRAVAAAIAAAGADASASLSYPLAHKAAAARQAFIAAAAAASRPAPPLPPPGAFALTGGGGFVGAPGFDGDGGAMDVNPYAMAASGGAVSGPTYSHLVAGGKSALQAGRAGGKASKGKSASAAPLGGPQGRTTASHSDYPPDWVPPPTFGRPAQQHPGMYGPAIGGMPPAAFPHSTLSSGGGRGSSLAAPRGGRTGGVHGGGVAAGPAAATHPIDAGRGVGGSSMMYTAPIVPPPAGGRGGRADNRNPRMAGYSDAAIAASGYYSGPPGDGSHAMGMMPDAYGPPASGGGRGGGRGRTGGGGGRAGGYRRY